LNMPIKASKKLKIMATYFRANKETVNEIYGVDRDIEVILRQTMNGEDLDMASLDTAIAKLEALKRTAREFEAGTKPTDSNY